MLSAIAVYQSSSEKFFVKKLQSAQIEKGMFARNPFEDIEKIITATMNITSSNKILYFKHNEQHVYIKAFVEDLKTAMIISKKKLDPSESFYLFSNIYTIQQKPDIGITLDDMVSNPFGFTGKEIMIDALQNQLDDVKTILIENIATIIERGEKIDDMLVKTERIILDTEKFKIKTKELNACCYYF